MRAPYAVPLVAAAAAVAAVAALTLPPCWTPLAAMALVAAMALIASIAVAVATTSPVLGAERPLSGKGVGPLPPPHGSLPAPHRRSEHNPWAVRRRLGCREMAPSGNT